MTQAELLDTLAQNPDIVGALIALLLGMGDAARRYAQNDDVPLHTLPLYEIRALMEILRKQLFKHQTPASHPSFIVDDLRPDELAEVLARQGVKPNHPFSYVYMKNGEQEAYNGIFYYKDVSRDCLPHRQIHVRAFEHGEGVEIYAHEEPHWWHHPRRHVKSDDMEYEPAIAWVKRRLNEDEHIPHDYPTDE